MTVYTYTSFFHPKSDSKGGDKADNFNICVQFNIEFKLKNIPNSANKKEKCVIINLHIKKSQIENVEISMFNTWHTIC